MHHRFVYGVVLILRVLAARMSVLRKPRNAPPSWAGFLTRPVRLWSERRWAGRTISARGRTPSVHRSRGSLQI